MYKISSGCCEWPAANLEIELPDSSAFVSPISIFIPKDRVDWEARILSKAIPGATIKLMMIGRIRAVYRDGNRIQLNDMRSFYTMTDEEYSATKFIDSATAELI